MHRVPSKYQIVGVLGRRSDNELGIRFSDDVNRETPWFENREFTCVYRFPRTEPTCGQRYPSDRMIGGWFESPGFSGAQLHHKIVQRCTGVDRTSGRAKSPDEYARRAVAWDGIGC
jgi:hypothetical protein